MSRKWKDSSNYGIEKTHISDEVGFVVRDDLVRPRDFVSIDNLQTTLEIAPGGSVSGDTATANIFDEPRPCGRICHSVACICPKTGSYQEGKQADAQQSGFSFPTDHLSRLCWNPS